MRVVFGLVLLLGLGLAGFAVYMAQGYIGNYQAQLEAERAASAQVVETTSVFVTTRAVRYGEPLVKDDMRPVLWPVDAIPEGAITTVEDLFPRGFEVPRVALRAMEKDEAVLSIKVSEPGADAGITSRLSAGKRAFAITVDAQTGVSGFLRPNDFVDVYWTGAPPNQEESFGQGITKLIEARLRLIAIDQSADIDTVQAQIAQTVTVEASPQQIAALAQAQSTGNLSLSLVGLDDETVAQVIDVDQGALLGIERQEEVFEQEEQRCTIRTRKGAEVVEIPIPCTQ
ncbi:MAG: Flp pilus assembly protein CpaB [Pseudomonadota bacterium]